MKKILDKLFPLEVQYPYEILDIYYQDNDYHVTYKVKMMPQEKSISLSCFLNDDSIVAGLNPLEVRALTQLESQCQYLPTYKIDTEVFNQKTKTYEIILKNKFENKLDQKTDIDGIASKRIIDKLPSNEAFRLGYLYAVKREPQGGFHD